MAKIKSGLYMTAILRKTVPIHLVEMLLLLRQQMVQRSIVEELIRNCKHRLQALTFAMTLLFPDGNKRRNTRRCGSWSSFRFKIPVKQKKMDTLKQKQNNKVNELNWIVSSCFRDNGQTIIAQLRKPVLVKQDIVGLEPIAKESRNNSSVEKMNSLCNTCKNIQPLWPIHSLTKTIICATTTTKKKKKNSF